VADITISVENVIQKLEENISFFLKLVLNKFYMLSVDTISAFFFWGGASCNNITTQHFSLEILYISMPCHIICINCSDPNTATHKSIFLCDNT